MKKLLIAILLLAAPAYGQECGPDSQVERTSFDAYWGTQPYSVLNRFISHRECEQHYFHCELANWQLWNALNPPPDPVECASTESFVDYPNEGKLWKPVSDNTGKPVFLLPGEYKNVQGAVEVFEAATGQLVAGGRFRTCCPNGGRSHYDVYEYASNLDVFGELIVRVSNGDCFTVPQASQRWD